MATQLGPATIAEARFLRDELTDIAQRAQTFTSASGCIIAVLNDDKLSVCARAGSAPDIGVQIPLANSLASKALQLGRTLRSTEPETEAAVELAALRPLRIRALAVIPLGSAKTAVRGALAVLSETSPAFNNTQLAILRTMADVVSEKLQQQGNVPVPPAPVSSSANAPAEPVAKPVAVPPPPAAAAPAPAAPAPARTPLQQAARAASGSTVGPKPSIVRPIPPLPTVAPEPAKVDAALVEPLAAVVTPITKVTAKSSFPKAPKAAATSVERDKDIFSIPKIDLPRKSARHRFGMPAAVLAVMVIAGGVWAYSRAGHSVAASAPRYVAVPVSQIPGAEQPAALTPAGTVDAEPAQSSAASSNKSAESGKLAGLTPVHNADQAAGKSEVAKEQQHEQPADAPSPIVTEPIKITQAVRRPSATASGAVEPLSSIPALSLVASNRLPDLTVPKFAPPPPPTSQLVSAELIRRVPPTYPAIARQSGVHGTVVLKARISPQGQVTNVAVIRGEPLLNGAAMEAVKQWRYKPALLNGQPTESETEIVLNFKLPR